MKNIDKIFKDQLNQPQNPPAGAWDFIQSALDGEKRRKPAGYIWLPVSGIAAMFLIGVLFLNRMTVLQKENRKIRLLSKLCHRTLLLMNLKERKQMR